MHKIKNMFRGLFNLGPVSVVLSVAFSVFFVVAIVDASTTISTNVSTGGTLTVDTTSTLTGAVSMGSTLSVTGLATFLGGATTTQLTFLSGDTIKNASASSTSISGAVTTTGALTSTGLATLLGGATTTSLTLLNGETISNGTNGTITFGATNTVLVGTASSSAIMVGSDSNTAVSGIIFGFCTLGAAAITSATTTYANCTTTQNVTSDYKVFVQATSSLPVASMVTSASSTPTTGTINVRIHALEGTSDISADTVSLNFWGVR